MDLGIVEYYQSTNQYIRHLWCLITKKCLIFQEALHAICEVGDLKEAEEGESKPPPPPLYNVVRTPQVA